MKIITLSFDLKTKLVMGICIIIAITIIAYSFYAICIKQGNIDSVDKNTLEYYMQARKYIVSTLVRVNSNKNTTVYNIKEEVDLDNKIYKFTTDNGFEINITDEVIKLKKEGVDYIHLMENLDKYSSANFISFSSIINSLNAIVLNDINGEINKIEENGKIRYEIVFNDEYIKKIKRLEIVLDTQIEIKMYDFEEVEKYNMTIYDFVVKK